MAKRFTFSDIQLKVLANFATIHPSMLVQPNRVSVVNEPANSIIGVYNFEAPLDTEPLGLYNTQEFLTLHNAMSKPEVEVDGKCINLIGSNNDKTTYWSAGTDLVKEVGDVEPLFQKGDVVLKVSITADKLATIMKTASLLKAKYLFFETDNKKVRLTVANELESSNNTYEVKIEDGIQINNLTEPVKISMETFKILAGEYEVTIVKSVNARTNKTNYKTRWENLNNVVYYIITA